jgi:beta-lactamase class D
MIGRLIRYLTGLLALVLAGCVTAVPHAGLAGAPLARVLAAEGVDPSAAALVIYRLEDGKTWTVGGPRVSQRFTPASTAKVPHTLLAFETGAVSGPGEVFEWDGTERWLASWNEDMDFATAFQRSAVWVYQIVVPRIGAERLSAGLEAFDYGNAEIGGPEALTRYWLDGPLAISAAEQVAFLSRLARRTLPLSARTYELAVPMMQLEGGPGWVMYGKTGWKSVAGEMDIGWFVGWVEQAGGEAPGTYVFALNMDMPGGAGDAPKRRAGAEAALREIGALPERVSGP